MAGYSKRSLVEKLGIKPGMKVCILHEPEGYAETLGPLPSGVVRVPSPKGPLDFIHAFVTEKAHLEKAFPALRGALDDKGMLWVSWPKGASKRPTDLNENVIREIGLRNGLVDVKVAAVDEVWSGLKFVVRLKDRKVR